jgi:hypothetical protein
MPQQDHTLPDGSRPILAAPGYRIVDGGVVWSSRRRFYGDSEPWHIIKPRKPKKHGGHLQIGLMVNGKKWQPYIHQLVLEAFVGPCPPGLEACHNDGNPANNFVSNLRWDSPASNAADAIKHGVSPRGERNASAKLKEKDIPIIFRLWRAGYTKTRIAKIYGTTDCQICNVINRKNWSHVQV